MNQGYIKFFKKVFLLIAIMFVVDRGLGGLIEYYYLHEPMGDVASFSHAINDPKEDLLIYGSSRAVHTYDTKVFVDTLGVSTFNCGRNASNVIYHSAILPAAINGDHKPKAIVLDLIAKEIAWRSGQFGEDVLAGMLLPYVLTNDNFATLSKELFPKEYYKARVSKLYAYNSHILSIIKNYSRRHNDNINGFQPLHGSKVANEPEDFTSGRDKIDEFSRDKLEEFIKSVTDKKIPLVVILSPMYVKPFEENAALTLSKQIIAKYNVPFWDYSTDPRFVKKELFYDMAHMNTDGAELFSKEIASRMKREGIIK
ncbi:MAG: hypothetical protein ABI861_04540 [Panacibacter sp.]